MKLRAIVLGLVGASAAFAETPATPPSAIELVEETGKVPLDCDKRLGAYQFATERYEAKVKAAVHTWEDVANYHSTRADWLQCVSNNQFDAIKAERRARNELITQLNAANTSDARLDEDIRSSLELFAQCDKAPLPADQALKACGPQAFIQACAASTVKRQFTRENNRAGGPRSHLMRAVVQQHLLRRLHLLECITERDAAALAEPQPEALHAPLPEQTPANR